MLGSGMIGAGFFGFSLGPAQSKSAIFVLLGMASWVIGLLMSAPKLNTEE